MHIDTARYFYSALAQSMAALFTLGAIFAIFSIESFNQQYSQACKILRNYLKRIYPLPHRHTGIDERDTWLDKDVFHQLLTFFETHQNDNALIDIYSEIKHLRNFEKLIKILIWLPAVSVITTFTYSLFVLMQIDNILPIINIINFISIGLIIFTIILSFIYILISIKGPNHEFINSPLVDSEKKELKKIIEQLKLHMESQMFKERAEWEKMITKRVKKISKGQGVI